MEEINDVKRQIIKESLYAELAECREESRNNDNQIVQIISLAGVFLGIIYGVFWNAKMKPMQGVLFILNVGIVCAACSYLITLGIKNVFIYYHTRDIEKRLKQYELHYTESYTERWTSLMAPIVTRKFGHLKTPYGWTYHVAYTVATMSAFLFSIIVVGSQYYEIRKQLNIGIKIVFCIFVALMVLLLLAFFLCTFRTQEMYQALKMKGEKREKRKKDWLKIIQYYIYPKMQDFQKIILFFVGWGIGYWLKMSTSFRYIILANLPWREIFFLWIIMDVCFYQARYQWNDIRGEEQDFEMGRKNRLPIEELGRAKAIIISLLILNVRIILGVFLAWKCTSRERFLLTIICAMILLGITILYEYMKSTNKGKAILFMVSVGYPYRVFVGFLWAYSDFLIRTNLPLILCFGELLFAYLFYGAFVVYIPWTIETIKDQSHIEKQPHYKILYLQVGERIKNINNRTPFRFKGKLTDLWNWTYLISIVLCGGFAFAVNRKISIDFIFMEILFMIFQIRIIKSEERKKLVNAGASLCIIIMLFGIMLIQYTDFWEQIFILHQIFFFITYFCMIYFWNTEFQMKETLKEILIKIVKVIVGKSTYEGILKELKEKSKTNTSGIRR